VNVNLKLRSRSLSYEDIQPPLESTGLRSATNKTIQIFEKKDKTEKNDKKIDEIYQLAREDVQKRIASIDKRLDENIKQKPNETKEPLHSVRKNSVEKPETKEIIMNEVNKVLEGPQKQGQQASDQQKEKQDTKRSDSGRKKQDENAMRELKMLINKGIPMKIDMQPTKLTPKNISYNAGLEKEKVSFKTNLSKIERTSSSHKDFHTGESSSKRSQQQVIQCPDSKVFLFCMFIFFRSQTNKWKKNRK